MGFFAAIIVAVIFAACEKKNSNANEPSPSGGGGSATYQTKIVGSWKFSGDYEEVTYTFKADRTAIVKTYIVSYGEYYTSPYKYIYDESTSTLKLKYDYDAYYYDYYYDDYYDYYYDYYYDDYYDDYYGYNDWGWDAPGKKKDFYDDDYYYDEYYDEYYDDYYDEYYDDYYDEDYIIMKVIWDGDNQFYLQYYDVKEGPFIRQ